MTLVLACLLSLAQPAPAPASPLDHDALLERCNAIARAHPAHCRLDSIGRSRGALSIPLLVLESSRGGTPDDARPALLIVAGLDGTHLVGTSLALGVAESLLADHEALLERATVYVVPRANPDAAALTLAGTPQRWTLRRVDDDRDGAVDEDGPEDIDGDGRILLMRILDPAPPEVATLVADPDEPRLLRPADPVRGERPRYRVLTEGIDNDKDGLFNEDGPGGVDLNLNFTHRWPEHEPGAGPYQLSEPESKALARFVLDHPEISAAIVFGPHDTVINLPDSRAREAVGTPSEIDADDASLFAELSRLYKDLTGQTRSTNRPLAGSLVAWLYTTQGIPVAATTGWGRPDPPSAGDSSSEPAPQAPDGGAQSSGEEADGGATGAPGESAGAEAPSRRPERRGRRGRGAPPVANAPTTSGSASTAGALGVGHDENLAWLRWSDAALDGAGFIEWRSFEHPQLGAVEIGGFEPGLMINPPDDMVEGLTRGQVAFAAALVERLPRLVVEDAVIEPLGAGLYTVHAVVRNDGALPTATAYAERSRMGLSPVLFRMSLPADRVLAGDRVERAWNIPGGGAVARSWTILGQPGETVQIKVRHALLGERTLEVRLPEMNAGEKPGT